MRKELYVKLRKAAVPGEKKETVKEIVKEYGLDYRTVNALVKIINNESGITKETIARLADKNFYTLDNAVVLAKRGLTEIIPAEFFSDDEFLRRSGIDYIPEMFLCGNDDITEYAISPYIKTIGFGAFMDCQNLRSVIFNGSINAINGCAFKYAKSLKRIEIPDSCSFIGEGAFMGCSSIEQFRIPQGVNELRSEMFKYCFNLRAVLSGKNGDTSKIVRVGDECFYDCTLLEDIDIIPTQIGYGAFCGCESLNEIIIDSDVVESAAFAECSTLETIAFAGNPPAVIRPNAFAGCKSLKHVISDGFSYALRECSGYYSLTREVKKNMKSDVPASAMFYYGKNVNDIVKDVPKTMMDSGLI